MRTMPARESADSTETHLAALPRLSADERLAKARAWFDWEAHPGQRRLLTLQLPDGTEPQTVVAACGRRWGKTEALAADIAVRLLTEPDLGQLIVAPTRDQAAGLFDSVEEKLRFSESAFALSENFQIKQSPYPHIRRKSDGGTVLSCRTAGRDGRNLRGKGATRKLPRFRVVVDEAAFVSDAAIKEVIRPMLATVPGGGQLTLISSPNGRRGAFYELFQKGEQGALHNEGRVRALQCPSADNPLTDAAFLEEMRAEMSERAFRAEFLAEFTDAAGAVFPENDIVGAICDDDYGDAPLWGVRYAAGVDFARHGDYTVCIVVAIGPPPTNELRVTDFLRLKGLGWHLQAANVADCLQKWRVPIAVTDRTGVGDAATEALTHELLKRRAPTRIDEFVFSSATKTAVIDDLCITLAQKRLRFPAHPDIISELRNFEIIGKTVQGRDRMEAARGHDDCVIALSLALHAAKPLLGRSGSVGATGGRRVLHGDENEREEFSGCEQSEKRIPEGSSAASPARFGRFARFGKVRTLPGVALTGAYHCAAGRRAGAFLRRTFWKD